MSNSTYFYFLTISLLVTALLILNVLWTIYCILLEIQNGLETKTAQLCAQLQAYGYRADTNPNAPVESTSDWIRNQPLPPLAPQDIAPNLKNPPRSKGGFGSKVVDDP